MFVLNGTRVFLRNHVNVTIAKGQDESGRTEDGAQDEQLQMLRYRLAEGAVVQRILLLHPIAHVVHERSESDQDGVEPKHEDVPFDGGMSDEVVVAQRFRQRSETVECHGHNYQNGHGHQRDQSAIGHDAYVSVALLLLERGQRKQDSDGQVGSGQTGQQIVRRRSQSFEPEDRDQNERVADYRRRSDENHDGKCWIHGNVILFNLFLCNIRIVVNNTNNFYRFPAI